MHPYYYVQYVPISLKQDPLVSDQTYCVHSRVLARSLRRRTVLFYFISVK